MPQFIDQLGRTIILDDIPQRIISLVPSQTELLYDLGLDKEVTGITKFCVHPDKWFRNKTRVGGTRNIKMEIIDQLQPDLIIGNKEENAKEQIEEMAKHYPVWISDVKSIQDATCMIEEVGKLTGKLSIANNIVENIDKNFKPPAGSCGQTIHRILRTNHPTNPVDKLQTAYLIWREPYMTVGGDTFISSMMQAAGFENIFQDNNRYPEITFEELRTKNLELLLLSSEPYPFRQHHADELKKHLPRTKIMLVDGEMFSWYGSRLLRASAYFEHLLKQIRQ